MVTRIKRYVLQVKDKQDITVKQNRTNGITCIHCVAGPDNTVHLYIEEDNDSASQLTSIFMVKTNEIVPREYYDHIGTVTLHNGELLFIFW